MKMFNWKISIGCLVPVLFLGACAGLKSGPVSGVMAPAPIPQYQVGDRFVYNVAILEDVHEVVAVHRKSIFIKSNIFGTLTQPKDFSNPESWTGGVTKRYWALPDQELSGLFPLKVGNQVSGTGRYTYSSSGTFARTCTVKKQLRITVPAGEFDTYQIKCSMNYTWPRGTNQESDWIYYAPEVGHYAAISRHGRMFLLRSFERK